MPQAVGEVGGTILKTLFWRESLARERGERERESLTGETAVYQPLFSYILQNHIKISSVLKCEKVLENI